MTYIIVILAYIWAMGIVYKIISQDNKIKKIQKEIDDLRKYLNYKKIQR